MKKLLLISLAAFAFSACIPSYVATGVVITEEVGYEGIVDGLVVEDGFDVVVDETLPLGKVVVTTHKDIMKQLDVYVEDNSLHISLKGMRKCITKSLEARVPAEVFNTFVASGGSDISGVNVDAEGDVAIVASGGSEIEISGRCKALALVVSGGSTADLEELEAEVVAAVVSGGSEADLWATKALELTASGGSEVEYKGSPTILEVSATGGSEVSRAE